MPTRATELEYAPDVLDRIEEPHVRASAQLQKAFGLRREEAIKIRPQFKIIDTHKFDKAKGSLFR